MSDGKQEDAKTSAGRSLAFIGLETVSEPGPVPNNTTDKWPRRLLAEDGHYQVHKVARVELRKGILSFTFVHEDGKEYHGPFYWDTINGERPEAALMLERNGLRDILRGSFRDCLAFGRLSQRPSREAFARVPL